MSYDKVEHADNPVVEGQDLSTPPGDDEREAVEAERERRLDPANRPDEVEVDNTDATLPTVEEFDRLTEDEDVDGSAGTADPSAVFREMEVSEEEQRAIAEERERRLDPANRPDGAEVDNTDRTFDGERFTD